MPAWQSGAVGRLVHQALPVLWPSEWRVTTTRSGLYLVEANSGQGWWLERMSFRLGDAFVLGEALHGGPGRLPELAAYGAVLPETYRISTDDGWQGSTFRAAVEDNPFSLEIRPAQAFASAAWARALAEAEAAIAMGRSGVVSGGPGTGKSLFLRALAGALLDRGIPPCALRAGDPPRSGAVLLVDDADSWSAPSLQPVLQSGAPVVLATKQTDCAGGDGIFVTLAPLSVEEVARFAAMRLREAGRHASWAEPDALLALASHSGGVFRDVIVLAGAAAFLADLEHAPRLGAQHVEHAASIAREGGARLLRSHGPERRPARARSWLRRTARVGAACAGLAFVLGAGWSARWVGSKAEFAQLEEQRSATFAQAAPPAPSPAIVQAQAEPPAAREPATDDDLDDEVDAEVSVPAVPAPARRPSGAIQQVVVAPASLGSFRGPVNNETLQLTGKLALDLTRDPATGAVRALFHAWNGLLGTGQLRGTMTSDGRVTLSGQLLMGRNPFICTLTGVVHGDRFTGSAQFVRPWGGPIARSSFNLLRT